MSVVLVCGGRSLQDDAWVYSALAEHIHPWDTVLTGGATGADTIAHLFAKGMGCTTVVFHADWERGGKSAGPKRNARMLTEGQPDIVLAFPGGRGTADMVRRAQSAGVRVIMAAPTE